MMLGILLALSGSLAHAAGGATANGCTYQVINGEYRYFCDAKTPTGNTPSVNVSQENATPRMQPTIYAPADQSQRVLGESTVVKDTEEEAPLQDSLYAGGLLGSNTVTKTNGSALAAGVAVGSDLDENWGLEFSYTYAKQDLALGLAGRSGTGSVATYANQTSTDAALSTHLISAEMQYHLTETKRRLRPFAGAGFAWRAASLDEKLNYNYGSYNNYTLTSHSKAQINQKSLGLLASVGSKLRFSEKVFLSGSFRFFLPISRQDAQFSGSNGPSRLQPIDSDITGSGQYQLCASLFFNF